MARWIERLRHPLRSAANAWWLAGHFRRSLRRTWFEAPEWRRAMNRRLESLPYGPLHIFLEAASPCNLRCPMCPTGAGKVSRPPGFLKPDLVEKLIADLRNAPDVHAPDGYAPEYVGLWLAGEPLLNRRLPEIIRLLADAGVVTRLHTNATLLTEDVSHRLIESGLSWISFSFDGPDPQTYARMRVGGDYEKTLANIRAFLRIKAEMGAQRGGGRGGSGVGGSGSNAAVRSLPYVVIQVLEPFEGGGVSRPGLPRPVAESARRPFEGLPVDEFLPIQAHAWSGQLDEGPGVFPNQKRVGRRTACYIPYTDLTLAWNGDAVTCCGDLNAANVLGNLYRENLFDLWNNEHFRRLRRQMHTPEIESRPLCGECERIWTQPHPLDFELRLQELRYKLRF